ncbi:GDP-D-glucose phosphorylase 1 [Diaphorina citri]|uniref:GDP-D-glucose phosphorylase 1 n=1 Tax=Diaphorina citri TaxID=121845 RepID=A0A1S3DNP9_DIACI|nr:GDP-D-glucose phosphorylase 1 [Diaphorina citri]
MFVPTVSQCLNQVVTLQSLRKAVEIMYLTQSPSFRIGFNSLCAFASLNHLHYHCYYLTSKMLLETIPVKQLQGPCYVLLDYPARGFVFQITSVQNYVQQIKKRVLYDIKPAICELFGHITVKEHSEFESITEDIVADMLRNLTAETFEKVYESVMNLYRDHEDKKM